MPLADYEVCYHAKRAPKGDVFIRVITTSSPERAVEYCAETVTEPMVLRYVEPLWKKPLRERQCRFCRSVYFEQISEGRPVNPGMLDEKLWRDM